MKRVRVHAVAVVGLSLALAGCPSPRLPKADSGLLDPDGRFTLYVTNQSYAIDRVDLRVEIDGELVVSDYFEVGSQHNFEPFILALSPGSHSIRAWSERGQIEFSREFELTNEDVGTVMFWHDPESPADPNRFIGFTLQEGPLLIE